MIIEQVKLKNYRQYKNTTVFDLGMSKEDNINIIIGSTGAGKTNFSNAIQWCLYGEEPMVHSDFGMLNLHTFDDLKEGEAAEVCVEVIIKTSKDERYSFIRTKKIEKRDGEQKVVFKSGSEPDGSIFKAYFHRPDSGSRPTMETEFPAKMISQLAPKKIREYFFFNGENLEQYFRSSTSEKIRDSIFKISQLDLLEKIENRLSSVIRDYVQESRELAPEIDKIAKDIKELEDELDKLKTDKSGGEVVLKQLEEKRRDFISKYKEMGGETAKELLSRNEKLEPFINDQKTKQNEAEAEKRNLLLSMSHVLIALEAFIEAEKVFQDAEDNKLIPPNIDPQFVKKLLEGGKCICGEDIGLRNKNIERRKNVEILLKRASTLGFEVGNIMVKKSDIVNIKNNKLISELRNLGLLNEKIKYNTSQLNRYQQEYDENIVKVGEYTKDKLENFEIKISELDDEIKRSAGKLAVLDKQIEESSDQLEKKRKDHSEHLIREEVGKKINNYIRFSETARRCTIKIKQKIMDEMRQKISEETERYFKELHWKKEENIKIKIHEDYSITALQGIYNKFGGFSRGEDALMTMSFIFALNNVSGFKVPIILDSALGRIDVQPRVNFASNLSKYCRNTQVILLFTNAEYSNDVEANLKPSLMNQQAIKMLSKWEAVVEMDH